VGGLGVLEQEPRRATAYGLEHVLVEVERREHDDPNRFEPRVGDDLARRLEPVDLGHADVHHHDVGAELTHERDRGAAVVGLAHHLEVVLRVEQEAEAGPDQRLVVGEHHSDHRLATTSAVGRCASTRKPPPTRGPAVSTPPTVAARSRMPARPWPAPSAGPVAAPSPSSVTSTVSPPLPSCVSTTTVWARGPACRITFVSDSCTIRYAATSTAAGMPSRFGSTCSS